MTSYYGKAGALDTALEIGETDRKILRLLYSGLDDARVAMEVGVSHRTVQRRVQSLMALLGARGRLALGARAQEAGLLYPPWPGVGNNSHGHSFPKTPILNQISELTESGRLRVGHGEEKD